MMPPDDRFTAFIRAELERESRSDFARLAKIPDTRAQATLSFWRGLDAAERAECLDCLAMWGARASAYSFGLSYAGRAPHPFEFRVNQGRDSYRNTAGGMGIPLLRAVVSQVKMEQRAGQPPSVPASLFDYAMSIHSVKAPELRKAVRLALREVGLHAMEKRGGGYFEYHCLVDEKDVEVGIDYGGRHAQLRYHATPAALGGRGVAGRISLERTLGLAFGDWDFITEENVSDSMKMLCECIRYVAALPARVEDSIKSLHPVATPPAEAG